MDSEAIKGRARLAQLRIMEVLAYGVMGGFFAVLGTLLFIELPQGGHDALLVLLGALTTAFGLIVSYFFGSSASSANKDNRPPMEGKASVPVAILAALLLLTMGACSKANIQANTEKVRAVVVKVRADAQKVLVQGCEAMPAVEVGMALVKEFLPPGSTTEDVNRYVAVSEQVIGPLCAKVRGAQS